MQYDGIIRNIGDSGMKLQELKGNSAIIIIAVAVVFGLIFILQNFERTSFQFLIWTLFTGPKWIVISVVFLLGMAFGYLLAKNRKR